MRASSYSLQARPWRAQTRKRRQGHARRYKTVRATSSNSALVLETAKFRPERRLRVSAKYLIRLGGISPPPRLAPAAHLRREDEKQYITNPHGCGEKIHRYMKRRWRGTRNARERSAASVARRPLPPPTGTVRRGDRSLFCFPCTRIRVP